MSVLSDVSIRAAIATGHLRIDPLGEGAIQPNSLDLRLAPSLKIATPDGFKIHHLIDDGRLRLHQGMFILGATLEWIEIPNDHVGFLWGKSSLARKGIQVHAAGLADSGWKGDLTLEIVMLSPLPNVYLEAGMWIAQIVIEQCSSEADNPYGSNGVGRYQRSHGAVESRVEHVREAVR